MDCGCHESDALNSRSPDLGNRSGHRCREASRLALSGRVTDLEHWARALACDGLVVLAELVEALPDTGEASRSDTVDGCTVEADLPDGGDLDAVA